MNSLTCTVMTVAAGLLSGIDGIPKATTVDLSGIIGLVYAVAAIVAVIVIIIGGISYSTSAGDASKMAKAKNSIMYGLIGVVIVGIAFPITIYVAGLMK